MASTSLMNTPPLFSIIYSTEAQAEAAHTAIETALAKAVAVGTR